MQIKIHKSCRDVIAICDTELIGKFFEKGESQLDIKESFFKGNEINAEELLKIIKKESAEDSTFNIVGPKSIQIALKAKIISEQGIKKIQDIPYALVLV